MKKILFASLLISVFAYAGLERLSRLGPALASLSVWANSGAEAAQAVNLTAGSAGVRNCLSKLTVVSNSTATVRILNAGTTVYTADIAANTPLLERWDGDDMCGSTASALHIKVSTGVRQGTLSVQSVNYTGFTY